MRCSERISSTTVIPNAAKRSEESQILDEQTSASTPRFLFPRSLHYNTYGSFTHLSTLVTPYRMDYEVVIGLEVHSQLLTRSKMFCGCAASYQDAAPNTMVCEVCMGMPGVLPTINRRAVEIVIATGLALDCTVSELTKFDRKNYPYPDLMKGYQISQFDQPIAKDGKLTVDVDGDGAHDSDQSRPPGGGRGEAVAPQWIRRGTLQSARHQPGGRPADGDGERA